MGSKPANQPTDRPSSQQTHFSLEFTHTHTHLPQFAFRLVGQSCKRKTVQVCNCGEEYIKSHGLNIRVLNQIIKWFFYLRLFYFFRYCQFSCNIPLFHCLVPVQCSAVYSLCVACESERRTRFSFRVHAHFHSNFLFHISCSRSPFSRFPFHIFRISAFLHLEFTSIFYFFRSSPNTLHTRILALSKRHEAQHGSPVN